MSTRMKWLIALTMVAVQCALVAIYFAVEAERDRQLRTSSMTEGPPQPTEGKVTSYQVTRRDGTTRDLVGNDRPVLVHFWGTWCPPCRDELPELLEISDADYDVVAVALDDDWESIDDFLDGAAAGRVVMGDAAEAKQAFDIGWLPQTFLMQPDGTLVLSVNGARDWSDPDFVAEWQVTR